MISPKGSDAAPSRPAYSVKRVRLDRWLPAVGLAVGVIFAGDADPTPNDRSPGDSALPVWETGTGFRRTRLPPAGPSNPGFTLLPPDQTGVRFTNRLADSLLATNQISEVGSGVALGDVNGDGLADLYFCAIQAPNKLFLNRGEWKFEEAAEGAGIACAGEHSTGALFADTDGDGDLDLLVNSIGGGTRCFLNDGKGRFTENTAAGLKRGTGSTSMALADLNGDGFLDLYVANYHTRTVKDLPGFQIDVRQINGRTVISPPGLFLPLYLKTGGMSLFEKGQTDQVYLNTGPGGFKPLSWTEGAFLEADGTPLKEAPHGWGLHVLLRDLNGDGAPDIYVCNDFFYSPDFIWTNSGSGRFRAVSSLALRQTSLSSMAVDCADINRDGHDDLLVADMMSRSHQRRQRQRGSQIHLQMDLPIADPNYRPEYPRNALFLNRGDGTYAEIAQLSGLDATEWTWSIAFLDVDLDGYEDVLVTNGNVRDANDADVSKGTASPMNQPSRTGNLRFPRLETRNLAFRNNRDLTFRECGSEWGFDTSGISHGMALGDLDGDGDLDLAVNHLDAPAGIYRNNSTAPRIAIRLRGRKPNTQAIGAKIVVHGGAAPNQSQEITSGGRYLSGDDPIRMFAAGSETNRMQIEVRWRSGRITTLENVDPNYFYEIAEDPADLPRGSSGSPLIAETTRRDADAARPAPSPPGDPPLFEDVSTRLKHPNQEKEFDDFQRQPLLPRKLSHLGPSVGWFDLSEDGHDDLWVGAGRGGYKIVYINDGKGGFQPMRRPGLAERDQTGVLAWRPAPGAVELLSAETNYEDPPGPNAKPSALVRHRLETGAIEELPAGDGSATGSLALGILDGTPMLFIGGRARPGKYPHAASSQLYRFAGNKWEPDQRNARVFENIGLVSGAVWTDLDNDGTLELALACEWGPIRIFQYRDGQLREVTQELGLDSYTGLWNGIATGDLDGDGLLDLVATNWGRNTKYERHRTRPIRLYYAELPARSRTDLLEAYFDPEIGQYVPFQPLMILREALPEIGHAFETYAAYASASVETVFRRAPTLNHLEAQWLESTVFLNRSGRFEPRPLPNAAQFAPAFGVCIGDCNGDGKEDIFLAQNFFGVDPDTSRSDAGRGLWLRGNGGGEFTPLTAAESGVALYGEQRGAALCDFDGDARVDLVVGQNGESNGLFHNVGAKPGIRVRLRGPSGNPDGIGAVLRLQNSGKNGPVRMVSAGSGYWSQNSPVQVMGRPDWAPAEVWVRWPGGKVSVQPIPPGAREVVVSAGP